MIRSYCYLGYTEVMSIGHWLEIFYKRTIFSKFLVEPGIASDRLWDISSNLSWLYHLHALFPGKIRQFPHLKRENELHAFWTGYQSWTQRIYASAALVSTAPESLVSWQGIEHMTPVLEARFQPLDGLGYLTDVLRLFRHCTKTSLEWLHEEIRLHRWLLHHVTPSNIHDSVPKRRFSNGLFNLAFLHTLNILYGKQTGDSNFCPCMELDDHPHNWAIAPSSSF